MIHVAFPSTLFLTNALYDRYRPSFPTLFLGRNGARDSSPSACRRPTLLLRHRQSLHLIQRHAYHCLVFLHLLHPPLQQFSSRPLSFLLFPRSCKKFSHILNLHFLKVTPDRVLSTQLLSLSCLIFQPLLPTTEVPRVGTNHVICCIIDDPPRTTTSTIHHTALPRVSNIPSHIPTQIASETAITNTIVDATESHELGRSDSWNFERSQSSAVTLSNRSAQRPGQHMRYARMRRSHGDRLMKVVYLQSNKQATTHMRMRTSR
jgi:hypothetical protein